jgi:hypothetical protein
MDGWTIEDDEDERRCEDVNEMQTTARQGFGPNTSTWRSLGLQQNNCKSGIWSKYLKFGV